MLERIKTLREDLRTINKRLRIIGTASIVHRSPEIDGHMKKSLILARSTPTGCLLKTYLYISNTAALKMYEYSLSGILGAKLAESCMSANELSEALLGLINSYKYDAICNFDPGLIIEGNIGFIEEAYKAGLKASDWRFND